MAGKRAVVRAAGCIAPVVAIIAIGACTGGDDEMSSAPPATSTTAVIAEGRPEPAPGSPKVCRELAASAGLTHLGADVRAAALDSTKPDVSEAAAALRSVVAAFPTAGPAEDALARWAAAPEDAAAVEALAATFAALEEEVQAQCRFPLS
jgi:hypothetical protein